MPRTRALVNRGEIIKETQRLIENLRDPPVFADAKWLWTCALQGDVLSGKHARLGEACIQHRGI